jgi:hypothetical protein
MLALLSALVVALFVIAGGAAPAAAHAGHTHVTGPHAIPVGGLGTLGLAEGPRELSLKAHHAPGDLGVPQDSPGKPANPDCCCGSAACHAGATLALPPIDLPHEAGERLRPSPSSRSEQSLPSGLERPPRSPASA